MTTDKPKRPKPSSKPFTPRGAELIAGAEDASSLWDELMPQYAGLLDADEATPKRRRTGGKP